MADSAADGAAKAAKTKAGALKTLVEGKQPERAAPAGSPERGAPARSTGRAVLRHLAVLAAGALLGGALQN